jgi:hypothetical protein
VTGAGSAPRDGPAGPNGDADQSVSQGGNHRLVAVADTVPEQRAVGGAAGGELVQPAGQAGSEQRSPHPLPVTLEIPRGQVVARRHAWRREQGRSGTPTGQVAFIRALGKVPARRRTLHSPWRRLTPDARRRGARSDRGDDVSGPLLST